ncbi:hypothetical protein AT05_00315 [Schleiferia thermophila str. Yellowstone]|nr:hypothetical protein AT05_00315 [Schleiferia thermophila str. Yellowstone]
MDLGEIFSKKMRGQIGPRFVDIIVLTIPVFS